MKKIFTFVLLLAFLCMHANASGVVPEGLKQAIKTGNARESVKYFGNAVELFLPGKEEVCNKTKAEQLLNSFFNQYQVINFAVLYEGGKGSNQYAIGRLTSSRGNYRVTILLKDAVIVQLRIEEDNGN